MEHLRKAYSWLSDVLKGNTKPITSNLETAQEYKERWRSIYIIYFTMFLISLGFSIILTGVWPYLDKLDPSAGKEFMGYIVAANPFAQMLFSPLVGWWSNKLGSIRLPVLLSLALFTIASAMYSSLELFPSNRKYWMLWARFLVGVSSANIAACRSYLSAATTIAERTKAVSMISLFQVLGFVIGPALQAVVVPLGNDGVWLIENRLRLNMYTASGWINVFLSTFNFCCFLPFIFKERRIAAREAMHQQGVKTEKETWKGTKPDYLSAWTLIVAFFVIVFNFMLLETLGTSLTMDQFAWTKAQALYYMGILMSVGAVVACICFAMISPLSKRFPEVNVMIWGGFFFMVLGRGVYIPWGEGPPIIYDETLRLTIFHDKALCDGYYANITVPEVKAINVDNGNFTSFNKDYANITLPAVQNVNMDNGNFTDFNCSQVKELVGCPSSQEWCYYTRKMTLFQFIFGYALTAVGYPIGVTLIQTIFSKILGPRPQGVWMGLMTGSGCLSRVMGPVFVTYIYTKFGTNWTFGITTLMMILIMIWLLVFNKRLVPKNPIKSDQEQEGTELQEMNKLIEIPLDNNAR